MRIPITTSEKCRHLCRKSMIYLKNLKKIKFFRFISKLMLTICLCSQISQICTRKFQNQVYLCFGNFLKLKVTKGELIILNGLEMADAYLPGGWLQPPSPLPLLGLNCTSWFLIRHVTIFSNLLKKIQIRII